VQDVRAYDGSGVSASVRDGNAAGDVEIAKATLSDGPAGFRPAFAKAETAMALLAEGMISETNPAWDALFGYAAAECPGQPLSRFLPDTDGGASGALPSRECTGLKADGSLLHLEAGGFPFLHAGRTYMLVSVCDAAARRAREEALARSEDLLRRSREHLRTVISHAPLVLFALDAKGVFTLCEGRGLDDLGLSPEEALGKSAFDLYRHDPQIVACLRRALSGEEFAATVELRGQWFETFFSPIFRGYDELAGVIGVAINVDARRRAEEALRRSEEQLRNARRMEAIGRVAGGVAHDFNNLLTAIAGHAELLLDGDADAGRRLNAAEIRKAAERAASLTRQLLAFSRKQVLSPEALNLNKTLGEMDGMIRRLIGEGIELTTVLDPELGVVWADPGQLEQVILNLALHAREVMPRGGQLTLETANVQLDGLTARAELFLVPGAYVMLAVSDTGVGMDDEEKAHVFEPFFAIRDGGEPGLGLSAVYGIVKQSGGTIAVESALGKGTTFRIYLPRMEVQAGAPGRRESLAGEETVLLVEDEEAVRTLVREILRMHGYAVLEARHGGEAILISQRHQGPIQLLLTDMVMANMNGMELAAHLEPLRPEMRVLFISGYGPEQWGRMASRAAFLPKPFSPKTLAAKVREVLNGKALARRDLAGQR
jgi:PAS domain S-box-containing protein